MPIYEYLCEACKHELEKIQKFSDSPLVDCPACGAPSLRRKISAPAFRLKGGGWYETDFKSGGKKNLAEGSGAGADGAKSADATTEKSPASESAVKPAAAPSTSATASGGASSGASV